MLTLQLRAWPNSHHYVHLVDTFVTHTLPQYHCLSVAPHLRNSHFHTDNVENLDTALKKEFSLPATEGNILGQEFDMATQVCVDAFVSFPSTLTSPGWLDLKT